MKKAVLLHGTDGTPDGIWFPWLRANLEAAGYEVWAPQLPDCHEPNRDTYSDFLFSSGWDFTDNIVVGHSSGAVEVLNLLMDSRCPKVKVAVIVGAWAGGIPTGYPPDSTQFAHLFPRWGFKWRRIRANAQHIALLHGSDDPYCPVEQGVTIATKLQAPIMIVPNGGHLGKNFTELPQVWEIVTPYL